MSEKNSSYYPATSHFFRTVSINKPVRGWIIKDSKRLGKGYASNVFQVCKDENCDYVIKIIHSRKTSCTKREICFQKICAEYGICKPVKDSWLFQDKGGVIIMPILKETLKYRLMKKKGNNNKWNMVKRALKLLLKLHINLGIIHEDPHIENIMFDDTENIFFIDMGNAFSMVEEINIPYILKSIINDYKKLFYHRNTVINHMLKNVADFIALDMKKHIDRGDDILKAEKKTVSFILNKNYNELRFLISKKIL